LTIHLFLKMVTFLFILLWVLQPKSVFPKWRSCSIHGEVIRQKWWSHN